MSWVPSEDASRAMREYFEAGITVDIEASTVNKAAEVEATKLIIERVEETFDIKLERLVGDTNYGSAAMLNWLVNKKQIEPYVPVCDKSERTDGTLSRSDFIWNEQADEYRCPEGKVPRKNWRPFKSPRGGVHKDDTMRYCARESDCSSCPQKKLCCPNAPVRKVVRSIHENITGCCSPNITHTRISEIYARAQENRNVLRPPQTNLGAR